MIGNVLQEIRNKSRPLNEEDIPGIRHSIRSSYGFDAWDKMSIRDVLESYPIIQEEINKQRNFRFGVLRGQGHKNVAFKDV